MNKDNTLLLASSGAKIIQQFVKTIPETPGVYQMSDAKNRVLYIGKAKKLKQRLTSYTHLAKLHPRTLVMLAQLHHLSVSHTRTENEALMLEMNLIKSQKPRYNIRLRDDKSFPYILIRKDHPFPQILVTREKRRDRGTYYGPFGSGYDARHMIDHLQKAFLIRNCSDNVFANRLRPCLLHQIKRCAAPCVGHISQEHYAELIQQSHHAFKGHTKSIHAQLSKNMDEASHELRFEEAARLRDRIRALHAIHADNQQHAQALHNCDVIGLFSSQNQTCAHIFFYRHSHPYGSRSLFPQHDPSHPSELIMHHIIGQLYAQEPPPPFILVNIQPHDHNLLEQTLSTIHKRKIQILVPKQGIRKDKINSALHAAEEALYVHINEKTSLSQQFKELGKLLKTPQPPHTIEIFDNSHLQGTHALGAMVVATPDGFQKNRYRQFNMDTNLVNARDDLAMMHAMISRRFTSLKKQDPSHSSELWPDLLIIDGGKNQLNAALKALQDLGIDHLTLIGIAKGKNRNAGQETLFIPPHYTPLSLPHNSPLLFFLQRLRDESHRFAISSHRKKRQKAIRESTLNAIPGIGKTRKQKLIRHFGSAKATSQASLQELQAVEGISTHTALTIYQYFHGKV